MIVLKQNLAHKIFSFCLRLEPSQCGISAADPEIFACPLTTLSVPLRPSAKEELNATQSLPQLHFGRRETFALNFPGCGATSSLVKIYCTVRFAKSWPNWGYWVGSKAKKENNVVIPIVEVMVGPLVVVMVVMAGRVGARQDDGLNYAELGEVVVGVGMFTG